MESMSPVLEVRTESTGPNECRVIVRFKDGHEPFPSTAPSLRACWVASDAVRVREMPRFSSRPANATVPHSARARMRWEEVDSDARRVSRAELTARVAQARLEEIHHTVAELVSGDGLETVLNQVMAAAGRAVPALSYILAVTPSARVDRWLCTEGFDVAECDRILTLVESGVEVAARTCAIEVVSDRNHYGHLVAIRSAGRLVRTTRTLDPRVLRPPGRERPRFGGGHRRCPSTSDHSAGAAHACRARLLIWRPQKR